MNSRAIQKVIFVGICKSLDGKITNDNYIFHIIEWIMLAFLEIANIEEII